MLLGIYPTRRELERRFRPTGDWRLQTAARLES